MLNDRNQRALEVPPVLRWLRQHNIRRICIVSPHLDDAVYSVGGLLLSDAGAMSEVFTVFTETSPNADPAWALAAGFKDAEQEYLMRRGEDRKAMGHLRVAWQHVGASSVQWGEEASDDHAQKLVQQILAPIAPNTPVLILLPAGAGGPIPGWFKSFLKKILRQPFGAPPHGDHCMVRDRMIEACSTVQNNDGLFVGFYAEIPYVWSDTISRLRASLQQLAGQQLTTCTLRPTTKDKLNAARLYISQLVPILGGNRAYQLRVLGVDEYYFLPESPLKLTKTATIATCGVGL